MWNKYHKKEMSTRSKIILFGMIAVALVGTVFFSIQNSKNQPSQDYRYEIDYDYLNHESGEVSILIYKRNLITGTAEHYYSIGAENLYLYLEKKFPNKSVEVGKITQFSMDKEYIDGLSADNKFVSGKLIDPDTKQQIGHWIFDLDKKKFSEFTLDLSEDNIKSTTTYHNGEFKFEFSYPSWVQPAIEEAGGKLQIKLGGNLSIEVGPISKFCNYAGCLVRYYPDERVLTYENMYTGEVKKVCPEELTPQSGIWVARTYFGDGGYSLESIKIFTNAGHYINLSNATYDEGEGIVTNPMVDSSVFNTLRLTGGVKSIKLTC